MTLDICTALIKKCFRDLGLFASNIVAILQAVLNDGELVLVEHSVLAVPVHYISFPLMSAESILCSSRWETLGYITAISKRLLQPM